MIHERLYMHRCICDIDSIRNQADGESQYAAGAEGRDRGDFVFEVVLQGAIWDVYGDGCARVPHLERGLQILVAAFKHLPRTRTHPMPRQCRYVEIAAGTRGKGFSICHRLLMLKP